MVALRNSGPESERYLHFNGNGDLGNGETGNGKTGSYGGIVIGFVYSTVNRHQVRLLLGRVTVYKQVMNL